MIFFKKKLYSIKTQMNNKRHRKAIIIDMPEIDCTLLDLLKVKFIFVHVIDILS